MATKKDKINATVVIPRAWHDKLKRIADEEQCSVSDIIRQQIKKFLTGNMQKCIHINHVEEKEGNKDE